MNVPFYNKLVRNNIPMILSREHWGCVYRYLVPTDATGEVIQKVKEEMAEYRNALSDKERNEELADLSEILDLADELSISCKEINKARRILGDLSPEVRRIKEEKRKKKGGFNQLCFVISAEPPSAVS
jgi:predicted house-cleaning noncanonical NTP pyrophosphatase (MazG superfamily)